VRPLGGIDADFDGVVDDSLDGDYDFHCCIFCMALLGDPLCLSFGSASIDFGIAGYARNYANAADGDDIKN